LAPYWLDTVIGVYVLLLLVAERQITRRLVALAFGLPLVVTLWLTRKARALRDRRQGRPWRIYG
jgi:hypothetical protein